jgi:hypothetical protein
MAMLPCRIGPCKTASPPSAAPGRNCPSSFDTDYLLVKEQDLSCAVEVFVAVGHAVFGLDEWDTGSG